MSEKKMSSSRKHHLKSLMLSIAKDLLEQEAQEQEEEKKRYMEEHCPALSLPRGMQELQEMCRGIHHNVERIDEERYDLEIKVNKSNKETCRLRFRDLKGKFKKPVLRKVRMSADAMLKALLGSKHTVNMDLRANLKQVKKEDKDLRDVGDWRKNIEDKSGMDGRKKIGIHHNVERIDEERYDLEIKVNKSNKEIEDMQIKVQDLKGKFKKPVLRKVRMSADAMLKALLGSKHTVNMDLRANLKQVKKEVKEEDKDLRDVGDWRKNIEDKSGMDGRKKMFEAEA
ncbi:hypothetical protein CRUP_019549 [Coryphaenoides rupestris]|nr:hypothetical protein CRUP_019549 [Coryphaenoides rupestris]